MVGDEGVAAERPRAWVRVGDRLEPESGCAVWLRLDGQATRGGKPPGQRREQARALGSYLPRRVVPRSRVGPICGSTHLDDERPRIGGASDTGRADHPVETKPLAGPAPKWAAGPSLRDDGLRFVEQGPHHGRERCGIDTRQVTGILSNSVAPDCRTALPMTSMRKRTAGRRWTAPTKASAAGAAGASAARLIFTLKPSSRAASLPLAY